MFWEFLEELWPHLDQQNTGMCPPFTADTRLAITVLKLVILTSLWYVDCLFDVGKATTGEAILEL